MGPQILQPKVWHVAGGAERGTLINLTIECVSYGKTVPGT